VTAAGGEGVVGHSETTEKKVWVSSYTIPSMLLQVGTEILGKKENLTKKSNLEICTPLP
jgi:hypothetical protein